MAMRPVDSEAAFARELIRNAVWSVLYHEAALPKAHRTVAVIRIAIEQGFSEIDLDKIEANEEADPDAAKTAVEYMTACMQEALNSIDYHEEELRDAHRTLGFAKAVIMRGSYEIDLDEIKAEVAKELAGRRAEETA